MADDDEIIQRISLLGSDEIRKELEQLGDEGARALDKISKAGGGDLAKGVRALMPEVAALEKGLGKTADTAGRLPGVFGKIQTALAGLSRIAFGEKLADDAARAETATINLSKSLRGVGKDIRALGRVTDLGGLSVFGRSLALVSRNLGALAFPAVIGAMGVLANSAANATQQFQDLAFVTEKSPVDLQKAAGAALAFGGSVDKLGESLAKIPQAAKETATQQKALADANVAIRAAIDKGTDAIERQAVALSRAKEQVTRANFSYQQFMLTIALGLDPVTGLKEQLEDLDTAFRKGTISQEDFAKQSKRLNNQLLLAQQQQQEEARNLQLAQEHAAQGVRDANQAMADQVRAADEAERAARAQKKTLEENANAFVKLGVSASQLKNLKIEESFQLIGDRLSGMEKGAKRNGLAFEIFGENARKLIAALDSGAGGLARFIAEGQRVAPAFTEAQNAVGDKFLTAIDKTQAALGSLKNQFGITVSPGFIAFFDKITDILVAIRPGFVAVAETISKSLAPALALVADGFKAFTAAFDSKSVSEFITTLGSLLLPILKGIGQAIGLIISGVKLLVGALDGVAKLFNAAFGTNLDGVKIFAGIIAGLIIAFGGWVPLIALAVTSIIALVNEIKKIDFTGVKTAATSVWTFLANGFKAVGDFIASVFTGTIDTIVTAWTTVVDFFASIWAGIMAGAQGVKDFIAGIFNGAAIAVSNAFNTAIEFVRGLWESFKAYLSSWVQAVIAFFQPLVDMIKKIINFFASGASTATASGSQGFAEGGGVRGPGTGTSDSILARLSNGEFVVKAKAVRHYGAQFLHAINSMRMPSFPAFNMGGLVDALSPMRSVPRFAEGGAVGGGATSRSTFTLQLGNESFEGLSAPADTADRMVKFATVRAMRQSGRRPNWYGSR
jgi:hypothetical protein